MSAVGAFQTCRCALRMSGLGARPEVSSSPQNDTVDPERTSPSTARSAPGCDELCTNLNGPPAADCLWCAYVAPCVSVHCCRSLAAVGGRDGCADSQAGRAALAWLRLPAGLHSAAEQ